MTPPLPSTLSPKVLTASTILVRILRRYDLHELQVRGGLEEVGAYETLLELLDRPSEMLRNGMPEVLVEMIASSSPYLRRAA